MEDFEKFMKNMDYYTRAATQRASLMAAIAVIMDTDDDRSAEDIKKNLVKVFVKMVESDKMVNDKIDGVIATKMYEFCIAKQMGDKAVDEINKILNNE